MGFTALLCLLSAFTLTTQDLANVIVSPIVTAECDQQVTLYCNISSYQNGLSITHMEWSQDKIKLCTVNSSGEPIQHNTDPLGSFQCDYKDGRLSVTFPHVRALNSGKYRCKLRSNHGTSNEHTTLELKECCGKVEGVFMNDGPSCTFHRVYPEGEVHWFHGSHNLSDGSVKHNISQSVDEDGYLTIHSHLKRKSSHWPYNCSLKSTKSGRYIASTLVESELPNSDGLRNMGFSNFSRSQETTRTVLGFLVLLAAIMK